MYVQVGSTAYPYQSTLCMHEKKDLTLQPSFGDERGRLQKLNYCLMGRVWVSWHQPTIPDYQGFSLLLGLVSNEFKC